MPEQRRFFSYSNDGGSFLGGTLAAFEFLRFDDLKTGYDNIIRRLNHTDFI
ncbi:hypothetical protein [Paenibacillus zanthoxyli]|uniref:hypothetical protein n=1 Tax=Paenibacillus zanthoxyli TaxID=369399 RepID=UPI0004B53D4F|nr:hypothetical protein [Paenibacillus zanthoxyli]